MVDTSDEWIRQRTGMAERRIAGEGETTFTLSLQAAQAALEVADLDPAHLDLIIVATVTPDYPFPSTACLLQDALGADKAAAFDLSAGCSGFVYGLSVAADSAGGRDLRSSPGRRRRDTVAHHRLDRPEHLCSVWRWGRGRGAPGQRGAGRNSCRRCWAPMARAATC